MNPSLYPLLAINKPLFRHKLVIVLLFALVVSHVGAQEPKDGTKLEATQTELKSSTPSDLIHSGRNDGIRNLITIQEGQLPIILSAPHGGQLPIPGADARKGAGLEAGPSGFRTVRDVNTDRLALALCAALEAKTGNKPYLVMAKFAREYADVNRPSSIGYEAPGAKPVYDLYHGTLERFCREVRQKWGRGLLLDIHGQGSKRDTIFRGTGDGKSVSLLVERYGIKARSGPESFGGLLAATGVKIFPTDESREQSGFTGGYITLTYGSRKAGMDAIQLEFGGDYTNKDGRKNTADKLADAIIEFSRLYLPATALTKPDTAPASDTNETAK